MPKNITTDKNQFRMIAKTLYGLEEILSNELRVLGAKRVREMKRSVEFYGDKHFLYKSNIWCRTATRILKPIKKFRAVDENELYDYVLDIDWLEYLNIEKTFAIDVVLTQSNFKNSLFVAQKIKDALADHFREKTGRRPSVDLKNPDIRINCYIIKNQCTLSLDSSGEPLFKRGYRGSTGKAPLNEVLAAGIVMLTEWDKESAFIDAMCGSGTIIIEAALLARNIAPGLMRTKFGFMNWPDYDRGIYQSLIKKAKESVIPKLNFEMIGSDISSIQIREAARNARQAGVDKNIIFKQSPIVNLSPPSAPGILIINPPYGERMSVNDINEFYHSIGDSFKKNFAGFDAYIFTGNLAAAKSIGLRTARRIIMFNGPIECRLLKFEMYKGSRKSKLN